jgi:2-polyprenyl-6-methoxyphenol hydroxylase-like FAD-dependent oxidoreductase
MTYDAIVIGARCAGAPTAMLLSRAGLRVLLVDRAAFPSDHAMSTHLIWPSGASHLAAWGVLEAVTDSGAPPLSTCSFSIEGVHLHGQPCDQVGKHYEAWAPRRIVLDQVLVDAAERAGVERRERTTLVAVKTGPGSTSQRDVVTGVTLRGPDGHTYDESARVVIGADGRSSTVARLVGAPMLEERPPLQAGVFSYWRDVPVEGVAVNVREGRTAYAWQTNGGLTLVGVNVPTDQFSRVRAEPERHFVEILSAVDATYTDAVSRGQRVGRWVSLAGVSTYYRRSHGPGWVLIGDAGYNVDPGSAQGISDAFRDAAAVSRNIIDGLAGGTLHDCLATFEAEREQATRAMCELTYQMSDLGTPPPSEMLALYRAIAADQATTDRFFGVLAGTIPVATFFAPEQLNALLVAAN